MGQYRSVPDKTKRTKIGESERLSYASSEMCGWRMFLEDAHVAEPVYGNNHSIFAVFDGHGGEEIAKFCQFNLTDYVLKDENYLDKKYDHALYETFMKMDLLLVSRAGQRVIEKVGDQIIKFGQSDPVNVQKVQSRAGCTAVVCLITETDIYVANAGDSRCVVATVDGKAKALSTDHKPDDMTELKRIRKAGGDVIHGRVNGNLNLSRAIGDLQYKRNYRLKLHEQMITSAPDIAKIPLKGIEYIVLGCDGIFEVKTNQEIIDMVRSKAANKSLKETCEQIMDSLVAPDTQTHYGLDNMTMIVIKMKQPEGDKEATNQISKQKQ